jgi:hypothetical protein
MNLPDVIGPDTTVEAFEVESTGKIHLRADRRWGDGIACREVFVVGPRLSTQVANVDCKNCQSLIEKGQA